ncbi:hypothetical protein PVAP13_5KG055500 [Panicum virgatum]|uniref:Uncharacterized protein n=1 Tax=Panicum virgatum TaxID=38727 RepID=A0A8T0S7T0_PANVG|nr:hypothetical protein PVAP13_5KG055500 [Panicum virgatum]
MARAGGRARHGSPWTLARGGGRARRGARRPRARRWTLTLARGGGRARLLHLPGGVASAQIAGQQRSAERRARAGLVWWRAFTAGRPAQRHPQAGRGEEDLIASASLAPSRRMPPAPEVASRGLLRRRRPRRRRGSGARAQAARRAAVGVLALPRQPAGRDPREQAPPGAAAQLQPALHRQQRVPQSHRARGRAQHQLPLRAQDHRLRRLQGARRRRDRRRARRRRRRRVVVRRHAPPGHPGPRVGRPRPPLHRQREKNRGRKKKKGSVCRLHVGPTRQEATPASSVAKPLSKTAREG